MTLIEIAKMISIIIPFYNAKEFINQAVESAISQPETSEIIIVDDNSNPGEMVICNEIVKKNPIVKLYSHVDGKNHGAAASRNLGISKATNDLIAFLDADDYYLPNRFSKAIQILRDNNIDGVYEAIGTDFHDQNSRDIFNKSGIKELTTVREIIPPEKLFFEIINGRVGYFSLNGLTIRKAIINKIGLFSEDLIFHEDTEFIIRLCSKGVLLPGKITTPVAIRRVHDDNRITHHLIDKRKSFYTRIKFWKKLISWGRSNLSEEKIEQLIIVYLRNQYFIHLLPDYDFFDFFKSRLEMVRVIFYYPRILLVRYFWVYMIPKFFWKKNKL